MDERGGRTRPDAGKRKFKDDQEFYEWLDVVAKQRFDRRSCFTEGNWAALCDAFLASSNKDANERDEVFPHDEVPVPRWALDALIDQALMPFLSNARTKRGKGRNARWMRQYFQGLVDWERFREVWFRRIARKWDDPEHPSPSEAARERRKYQKDQRDKGSPFVVDMWTPYPWQAGSDSDDWDVFEAVSKIFSESEYGGSPDTIRRSYERVTKALRSGEAWRYYPSKYVHFEGLTLTMEENDPK